MRAELDVLGDRALPGITFLFEYSFTSVSPGLNTGIMFHARCDNEDGVPDWPPAEVIPSAAPSELILDQQLPVRTLCYVLTGCGSSATNVVAHKGSQAPELTKEGK